MKKIQGKGWKGFGKRIAFGDLCDDTQRKIERRGKANSKVLQFPIRLAFTTTINKLSGQYLNVVGLNLERIWTEFLRLGKPSALFVFAPDWRVQPMRQNTWPTKQMSCSTLARHIWSC